MYMKLNFQIFFFSGCYMGGGRRQLQVEMTMAKFYEQSQLLQQHWCGLAAAAELAKQLNPDGGGSEGTKASS